MRHHYRRAAALALVLLLLTAGAVAQTPAYSVLYGFTGTTDGSDPQPGLIHNAAGNLYGATSAGGVKGCSGCGFGVVFKLDPAGNFTVVHTFAGAAIGLFPSGGLLVWAGSLYGTTSDQGPDNGRGVIFRLR